MIYIYIYLIYRSYQDNIHIESIHDKLSKLNMLYQLGNAPIYSYLIDIACACASV